MDQSKANEIVQSLTVADIMQAYSGKPGCACGCNGKYHVAEHAVEAQTKSNGYAPSPEDVSNKQVLRILRQVQAAALDSTYVEDLNKHDRAEVCWNVADDLQYITATVSPRRVYTVYLMSAARRSRGIEKGYDL